MCIAVRRGVVEQRMGSGMKRRETGSVGSRVAVLGEDGGWKSKSSFKHVGQEDGVGYGMDDES